MIPPANVRHLMIDPEVAAAVAAGRFHVWAIDTIDEGLELLTGRPAVSVHAEARHRAEKLDRRAHRRRA